MSSNDDVLTHNPLDESRKKQDKKRAWIVFGVVFLVVSSAIAFFYARHATSMSETLQKPPPVVSKVTPASESKPSQKGTYMSDNTPAKLIIGKHEDEQKATAKAKGYSFIDSTTALQEKAAKVKPQAATKTEPQTEVVEQVNTNKQQQKPKPKSDDQIRRENMAKLMGVSSYYPSTESLKAEAKKEIVKFNSKIEKSLGSQNEYEITAPIEIAGVKTSDKQNSNEPLATPVSQKATKTPPKVAKVKAYGLGDMVMCKLKFEVQSDFKLPFFCDVVEPPLKRARLVGRFEMTPRQNGVLLRGTQIEYGDEVLPIEAYGVNITEDLSPLFDNNLDTHFMERFLSRASAAFMLPFVDFVTATTTTITNGNVVVDNPAVKDTKDRVIGGLASVAKEFLPDLRKNANIPPTVTIPDGYIIGMVMTKPLFVPDGFIDTSKTNRPTRPTTTFGRN
ncbi:hypothetical protein L1D14_25565 [Vibrio tubiashii]|uniref:hypothetical protein n=1 Tax=Vibrio tubiashii TaxID=29498 RepID=UPI001EFD000B|nr:hypothetical protein [Vibrio tubiashii]MCG9579580.1 hypothetical protein [Vibrio tubiashii]